MIAEPEGLIVDEVGITKRHQKKEIIPRQGEKRVSVEKASCTERFLFSS